MRILDEPQRSILNSLSRLHASRIACGAFCVLVAVLAWGCGGQPIDPPCCGSRGEWVPTETWPEQSVARLDVATTQIAEFRRSGLSDDEVRARQIEALRGAVVMQLPADAVVSELRPEDSWRPRLLASSTGMTNDPVTAIALLREQQAQAAKSEDPAALIREAAIRADLAYAIVALARDEHLTGEEWKAALREALDAVDGWCQVPEALLNTAAIHLELAALHSSADSERQLCLDKAKTSLATLLFSDAAGCSEQHGAFFGSAGSGSPIVFILDASGSMEKGDNYRYMLSELRETIEQLPSDALFSVLLFNENGFEVLPESRNADAEGRFLRASLGEFGKGSDLDALFKRLERVDDDLGDPQLELLVSRLARLPQTGAERRASCPSDALTRAVALQPKTIFLATDGMIEERYRGELTKIVRQLEPYGTILNTFLFFVPAEGGGAELAEVEAAAAPLRRICELTGGSVSFLARGTTSTLTLDRTGLARPTSLSETIYERAVRRGYWTPEADRQLSILTANLFVNDGKWVDASQILDAALMATGDDIVLGGGLDASAEDSWPRAASGEPVPADGALLYRLALALAMANHSEAALGRFDDAAVAWAACSKAASGAGLSAQAAADADSACRALLFGCMYAGDRNPSAADLAYARANELGVAHSAGWNQRLLAAGAGYFADWRAGAAVLMHDDDSKPLMKIELELVRSFFGRQVGPETFDFSMFPYIEAEFMRKVQQQIAEGSQR